MFCFDILVHPGAKTLGFGIPLAPSWDANGAQIRAFFETIAEGKLRGYSKMQGGEKMPKKARRLPTNLRFLAPLG